MRVVYTGPARRAVNQLLAELGALSPQGARRLAARIQNIERLLARFPKAGMTAQKAGFRRIKTPTFPYIIFYELKDGSVIIHAVRHAARRPFEDEFEF